jgi:hypothetical protein
VQNKGCAIVIESPFRLGHYNRSNAVANDINDGSSYIDHSFHAKQQNKACSRNLMHGGMGCRQCNKACSGDLCRAFGRKHQDRQYHNLIMQAQMGAGGLSDKDGSVRAGAKLGRTAPFTRRSVA